MKDPLYLLNLMSHFFDDFDDLIFFFENPPLLKKKNKRVGIQVKETKKNGARGCLFKGSFKIS